VGAAAVVVGWLGGSGPAQELGRKAFFFSDYFQKAFLFYIFLSYLRYIKLLHAYACVAYTCMA
jgi:hypothetical protein